MTAHAMVAPLSPELRSARLSALSSAAVRLGDVAAASTAVDEALKSPVTSTQELVARTFAAAGLDPGSATAATEDPHDVLVTLSACCHPSLPEVARIALMLSVAAGLPSADVARAFAVPEDTMAHRIAWAQNRVRLALGAAIPEPDHPEHLGRVLDVLLLIFDDGITHPHCQADLPQEALDTTRALVELFPAEQEPRALLALMLLTRARRDARLDDDGALISLDLQDRSLWHRADIDEGLFLLRGSKREGRTGRYQVAASIQAEHVSAREPGDTDWDRILALHDRLLQLAPSDTVVLGRAVALAEVRGPELALELVEGLGLDSHLFHATRAALLRRLGRDEEADRAWIAAQARVRGAAEHARLSGRMER
ncbi:MAG: DUF6596 domain-containing protein [Aeromicrobium sp.]